MINRLGPVFGKEKKLFKDLSGQERDDAVRGVVSMMRDQAYSSAYPNHTFAGLPWAPVGEAPAAKPTETQGWWDSMGGAFQNASMKAVNELIPGQLYPGMDSEKLLTKAYRAFQHLDTETPSHPSNKAAVDRIIERASPMTSNERLTRPISRDRLDNQSETDLQTTAENKAADDLARAIQSNQLLRHLKPTDLDQSYHGTCCPMKTR